LFQLYNNAKSAPPLTLSGNASSDVTAVNIYCFVDSDRHLTQDTALNTSPVIINAGKFTVAGIIAPTNACILRAIPTTTYSDGVRRPLRLRRYLRGPFVLPGHGDHRPSLLTSPTASVTVTPSDVAISCWWLLLQRGVLGHRVVGGSRVGRQ
jgi:hypothetical protein